MSESIDKKVVQSVSKSLLQSYFLQSIKEVALKTKKSSLWEFSSSNLGTILLLTAEFLFWKRVEIIQINPKSKFERMERAMRP